MKDAEPLARMPSMQRGCRFYCIHQGDDKRGVDTNIIIKTDNFYAPIEAKKNRQYKMRSVPSLRLLKAILIEEADEWRSECWDMISKRMIVTSYS